jgi:hypothetical protein
MSALFLAGFLLSISLAILKIASDEKTQQDLEASGYALQTACNSSRCNRGLRDRLGMLFLPQDCRADDRAGSGDSSGAGSGGFNHYDYYQR